MAESLTVELTKHQRDLVLQGLRYVRSSRRLEFRDPLAPPDEQRESELREVAILMGQLEGTSAKVEAKV
jgi:hypothetical protein